MALFAERSRIETDLSSRAQAALKQEGYSWASIKFDGRDAIVQGLAYSDDHPGKAGNVVGTTWGVRVVENKISLVEKTQRFFWRAAIRNNRIKLSGFVPSDAVRSTVVSLVKADFPDREVDDQLKAARGSPSQDLWLGAVTFALKQLANLKEGQVALEGLRLSIAGESASYPKFKALKSALAGGLPKGAELASDGVRPPKISPFTWAAAYNGKQLTIAGHAPSEDARTRAFEWAKRSFPKAAIVDRSEIADGGPREWSNAVQVSLSQLAYLNQGSAKLRDQSLIIDGVAEKEETADSVKIALRNSLLSSVKLTHDIKFRVATPRPVSPFVTSIAVEPSRIDLTGYAPGASSKAVLIGAVAKLFPDYAVSDRLQLAAGASNGWQACLVAGLDQLKRAGNGRLILTDQRLQMMATLVDEDLAEAIKGDLRTNTNRACETETKFKLVLPPEPSLNWSARRDNEEAPLLLSGEVPSEAAMTEIEAAAVRLFPSIKIANQMRVASGGPTKRWLDTATVGLAMLAKLRSGEARLNGTKLTVTGVARDAVSAGAVRDALTRTLAKGYSGSSDLAVKSDAMIWAEMEAKRKAEADRKAEENRAAAEAQARRNAEEDARRKAEEEARSKAAAEAKRRQAEVEARRQAEQAAQRRADEEARKRAAEEAERQRAGEEARRRLIEDARRQVEEEEARRRAAESAQALAIAEARRKAEEEARKRADEEARRLTEARRRAEEEARQQAERRRLEEERRQKEERALARARTSVDACQDVLRETAREGVIRFARSSADLEDASRETVERLARVANACPTARIEVEGHTDSDGRTANNQRLSERRAEALVRALVAAGVAADRLSSVGYGPSRPVAPNDTAENKAKNRRIEFTIKTAR